MAPDCPAGTPKASPLTPWGPPYLRLDSLGPWHLENTLKEWSKTFEIFDQCDEEIWPDQQKDNDKDKDSEKDKDKDNDI